MIQAVVYGDALMQCVLATRPYETNPGSTDALCDYWIKNYVKTLHLPAFVSIIKYIKEIIHDFDNLPVNKDVQKPRVGVVGKFTLNSIQVLTTISMNSLKRRWRSRYIWFIRLLLVLRNG